MPMPFALSRVNIDASKAMAVKMTVMNNPITSNMIPVESGTYSSKGNPHPNRKAVHNETASPENMLIHKLMRFTGCDTSNSINSAELYTYMVEKIILMSGTMINTIFNRLS